MQRYTLHEELLLASIGSVYGAAAFAFVTRDGVDLLINDEIFTDFIRKSTFDLVVGTDEITNSNTMQRLTELTREFPNLRVEAFLHDLGRPTFHPKVCWFKQARGGSAIVGSGNLTQKGLRKNWEAFSVIDLNAKQVEDLEQQWNAWLYKNKDYIKAIDDPQVLAKVAENGKIWRDRSRSIQSRSEGEGRTEAEIQKNEADQDEESDTWTFGTDARLLIAEIPKASNRWNQANFDKRSFESFFGATPGDNTQRVVFRGVKKSGELSEIEVRQSVSVKSHNWRFELGLAKGRDYPEAGRPVAIFVEVSKRMFLYSLMMPKEKGYTKVARLLEGTDPHSIRRIQFAIPVAKKTCPDLAIWEFLH